MRVEFWKMSFLFQSKCLKLFLSTNDFYKKIASEKCKAVDIKREKKSCIKVKGSTLLLTLCTY